MELPFAQRRQQAQIANGSEEESEEQEQHDTEPDVFKRGDQMGIRAEKLVKLKVLLANLSCTVFDLRDAVALLEAKVQRYSKQPEYQRHLLAELSRAENDYIYEYALLEVVHEELSREQEFRNIFKTIRPNSTE